jgi:hypothetical protein
MEATSLSFLNTGGREFTVRSGTAYVFPVSYRDPLGGSSLRYR